jgi:hypothetical protein
VEKGAEGGGCRERGRGGGTLICPNKFMFYIHFTKVKPNMTMSVILYLKLVVLKICQYLASERVVLSKVNGKHLEL